MINDEARSSILEKIKNNQPALIDLVEIPRFAPYFDDAVAKYIDVLTGIGGAVYMVKDDEEIAEKINELFVTVERIVSFCPELKAITKGAQASDDPHDYEDVDVFIMKSGLGVAENSALWITDNDIPERVLPFITQSLVTIINKSDIVPTMHDAYGKIAGEDYGFATFIAGPSKTADIEQSLVLGAHGPKTMTVFIKE